MPEPAGAPEPVVGADDVRAVTGAPPAAAQRPGWLRRATLVGSATALVAVTAFAGLGTAVPSVSKGTQDAYVTTELLGQLEAVPGSLPSPALSSTLPPTGMAVVSRVDAQVKTPSGAFARTQTEPAPSAACVALPIASGRYRISSNYGYRIHPIQGGYSLHTGVDYAAPLGTPIHAVTAGTVIYTGAGRLGRSSELVVIEHEVDGTTFYSWYVHMFPDGVFVTPGQKVRAGEVIAEVGNNGNSTGPHLHFEIHTSDPGVVNRKNPVARTTSAMVMTVDPGAPWAGWPVNEQGFHVNPEDPAEWRSATGERIDPETGLPFPAPPVDGPPTDEPTTPPPTGEPTTPPPTGEPTTPPPTGEPTTPPPTGEPTTPPPTGEPTTPPPTGGPTTPPPTGEPTTPPPTGEPSDRPTDPVTGEPTTPPPGEPTDGPTDPVTGEPTTPPPGTPGATPSPGAGPHTPFPLAAHGTTVDPARFLASLGILMVDPLVCSAP